MSLLCERGPYQLVFRCGIWGLPQFHPSDMCYTRRKQRYDFSKRLLANTRGENGEETTKDPRNPFTPCPFAACGRFEANLFVKTNISPSPEAAQNRFAANRLWCRLKCFDQALITPQNMKLDVNSYADHACGARRAPETTPRTQPSHWLVPRILPRPPAHHQIAHSGSAKGAVDDFITSACPETRPFGLARSFKPSPSRRSTAHSATDDQDHKLRF